MIKLFILSLLIVIVAVDSLAQSPAPKPSPSPTAAASDQVVDLGLLNGTTYTNNFFGLSLSIPREWIVVSAQQHDKVITRSKELANKLDGEAKSEITESIDRSTLLMSLTKLPEGEPNNAAFMLIAERLPSPTMKTGADVLRSLVNLSPGANFKVEMPSGIWTENIGGAEFGVATIKATMPNGSFMQRVYITTKKGYALEFFLTYLDAADLPVSDAIMRSVSVK